MKLFAKLFLLIFLPGCKNQAAHPTEVREVVFEGITGDSVIVFRGGKKDTLNIYREVEIVENKNTDTVLLGYSVIPPGFKGDIIFTQDGLSNSSAVYLDPTTGLDWG